MNKVFADTFYFQVTKPEKTTYALTGGYHFEQARFVALLSYALSPPC